MDRRYLAVSFLSIGASCLLVPLPVNLCHHLIYSVVFKNKENIVMCETVHFLDSCGVDILLPLDFFICAKHYVFLVIAFQKVI